MTQPHPALYIRFQGDARPALLAGDYRITFQQPAPDFGTQAADGRQAAAALTRTQDFTIAAPRFVLDPALIHSVYPPAGAAGDYANVLPHVVLTQDTLPWERAADGITGTGALPWLAVVLLGADELSDTGADGQTACIRAAADLDDTVLRPRLEVETTDPASDAGRFLIVPGKLVAKCLPRRDSLPLTTHVRERGSAGQPPGPAQTLPDAMRLSVVVGCRLPEPGRIMRAFLVSGEQVWAQPDFDAVAGGTAGQDKTYGLRILHDWTFTCMAEAGDFAAMIRGLDMGPLRLPASPPFDKAVLRPYLDSGRVPVGRLCRDGSTRVNWYSGPLLPVLARQEIAVAAPDGPRSGDAGLADEGLADAGLEAAEALGHAMMAAAGPVARDLMHHKRDLARAAMARATHPLAGTTNPPDCPASVAGWLAAARTLENLPFTHLVPDGRMLPPNSLRLCALDSAWMNRLLAGAWRVGWLHHPLPPPDDWSVTGPVTGILIRSPVVTLFPHMRIEADDAGGQALAPWTGPADPAVPGCAKRVLGPGLALALFRGTVAQLRLHLTPEALHYGLSRNDGTDAARFSPMNHPLGPGATNGAFFDSASRKLNFTALQAWMNLATPEAFARAMVEGVEQVILQVGTAAGETR